MSRRRPDWKTLRADREHGVSRHEAIVGYIVEAAKSSGYYALVNWNQEPKDYWPGVSTDTGPVTIYGPNGTVRERLSAEEFRRRYPPRLRVVRR